MADKYNHWFAKLLAKINKSKGYAITFGQTAYYSVSKERVEADPKWIAHENQHKKQYKDEGFIKFIIKYLYYSIRYGYKDNPYEVEARKVAGNR
jgi:hypothetical protein